MMGRARSRSRIGWPPNLYTCRDGFKYRHPVTKKDTWMGRDKVKAFAAAKRLNTLLTPGGDLVAKVTGGEQTVRDAVAKFREVDVPERGWADKTAEDYESVIRRIEVGLGDKELPALTVKDCAQFFKRVTPSVRARQKFRLVLGWILACAVEEGWIETNPALVTRKPVHKRKRDRLTLDTFTAIRGKAEPWLQHAMDLSLLTLLRREDVASLRFADAHDGALWVVPAKTEGSTYVRLKIALNGELEALLAKARDDVVSPYVIHRLPEKARPQHKRAKARVHHTQVLPAQLSRGFADAREAAGIDSDHPPTFHEIRSLGGALLREKGWKLAEVQALMGHASEAMTKLYMDGHDVPWQAVSTGITLPR